MKRDAFGAVFIVIALVTLMIVNFVSSKKVFDLQQKNKQLAEISSKQIVQAVDIDVLKGFASTNNDKVYDRLADEIVSTSNLMSKKYNIPSVLILSVIQAESTFDVNAVSPMKAKGLMQINMDVWGEKLKSNGIINKSSDVYDPVRNIEAGCFIIREYLNETKDFEKAMNKYLGVYYKPYIDRIGRNVGYIWMQNISKGMNATYNIK